MDQTNMTTGHEDLGRYDVFTRTWWKANPAYPRGLEPSAGRKHYLKRRLTWSEARDFCLGAEIRHKKDGDWLFWLWERLPNMGNMVDCGYSGVRLDAPRVDDFYILIDLVGKEVEAHGE